MWWNIHVMYFTASLTRSLMMLYWSDCWFSGVAFCREGVHFQSLMHFPVKIFHTWLKVIQVEIIYFHFVCADFNTGSRRWAMAHWAQNWNLSSHSFSGVLMFLNFGQLQIRWLCKSLSGTVHMVITQGLHTKHFLVLSLTWIEPKSSKIILELLVTASSS